MSFMNLVLSEKASGKGLPSGLEFERIMTRVKSQLSPDPSSFGDSRGACLVTQLSTPL